MNIRGLAAVLCSAMGSPPLRADSRGFAPPVGARSVPRRRPFRRNWSGKRFLRATNRNLPAWKRRRIDEGRRKLIARAERSRARSLAAREGAPS